MTIDNFIAEIKADFESFDSVGLIDDLSIYKWANKAVKVFGTNVMELNSEIVNIKNNIGMLPANFFTLYSAFMCSKNSYKVVNSKNTPQLVQMWVEKTYRGHKWESCDTCCTEETEKIVTKKVFVDNYEVEFNYNRLHLLRLGRINNIIQCDNNCLNFRSGSNDEININGETIHTNFSDGDINIVYYGLKQDDDGNSILPDSPKGEVLLYIEYYVKKRIFEKLLSNNDSPNLITMFNYYVRKEESQRGLALTDAKFSKLTPKSFKRLRDNNRVRMSAHENIFPKN